VAKHFVEAWEICCKLSSLPVGTHFTLLAPVRKLWRGGYATIIEGARREGYTQGRIDGEPVDLSKIQVADLRGQRVETVVDRLCVPEADSEQHEEFVMRLAGSVRAALGMGDGTLIVEMDGRREEVLSEMRVCVCGCTAA
jgi:excinuclease UvrABC ATPase subunit